MVKEVKVMQAENLESIKAELLDTDFRVYFYYFISDVWGEHLEDVRKIYYDAETDFYVVEWINCGSKKVRTGYIRPWLIVDYYYKCIGEDDE